MTAAGPRSSPSGVDTVEDDSEGVEVVRTREKVVRVSGDWAVHTFLDDDGNELHSIGFRREPLFTDADIEESQQDFDDMASTLAADQLQTT